MVNTKNDTHPYTYVVVPASDVTQDTPRLLVVLHGTGGNERDLIPVGQMVAPSHTILGVRGTVTEHGMPRFFARLAEGVLDEADLSKKADVLVAFIESIANQYGIPPEHRTVLGYSNGANIGLAMLLRSPGVFSRLIALRPMKPYTTLPAARLAEHSILLLSGNNDPLVHAEDVSQLAAHLTIAGASVSHDVIEAGHELTQTDIQKSAHWLSQWSNYSL